MYFVQVSIIHLNTNLEYAFNFNPFAENYVCVVEDSDDTLSQ